MAEFFGFEINRKGKDKEVPKVSFVPNTDEDGAGVITSGGHFGAYLDLDGDKAKNEVELILKYRDVSAQPEADAAIEDIINEAIVGDHDDTPVDIVLDKVDASDKIKKLIKEEFDSILEMLNFNSYAHDIFKRWYVDGRLPYHIIVDEGSEKLGIKELRYIDPRKIRKVRQVQKKQKGSGPNRIQLTQTKQEYYLFNDKGFKSGPGTINPAQGTSQGIKIAKDSILHNTSGLMSEDNKMVLSHLHKAIKPLNQLRILEDATVIYRISRAPERRIFYIDVGNLPKLKAEQYLRDMMAKHKNRTIYDANTGEIKDDRKFMTMLEDYWLPRREGGTVSYTHLTLPTKA